VRILHVGSGFRPWRHGGLVAYIEDLMEAQVARGHDVAYFFAGRQYPFVSGPRLKRWRRGDVEMLEVVNSPLFDHGRQPGLELAEPRLERLFERTVGELRPDVVHVHELAGLPSSLLEIAAPVVMTLHDYFPLCSTFKLFDSGEQVCLRRQIGGDCAATTAADPRDPGLMFDATVRFHVFGHPLVRRFDSPRLRRRIERLAIALGRRAARRAYGNGAAPRPGAFQRRRDLNVERLNGARRLVAVSERVREIYALLGVDANRIVTLHPTLAHIDGLRPSRAGTAGPVTFATLGGGESVPKGSRLLLEAVQSLANTMRPDRYRMLVFGSVDPSIRDALAAIPGVELRWAYTPDQLDGLLDEVDVGVVPSLWEEAYGLVGPEFLAKGIPLIANAIGGIVDYAREGETAWLNRSCSADELASIMGDLVEHPERIRVMSERARAARESIVTPMSQHADAVEELYRDALAA